MQSQFSSQGLPLYEMQHEPNISLDLPQDDNVPVYTEDNSPNDGKFENAPNQWRDLSFAIAFFAHLAGFGPLIFLIAMFKEDNAVYQGIIPDLPMINVVRCIVVAAILIGAAIILAYGYLRLIRLFPIPVIYVSLAVSFIAFVVLGIWGFATQNFFQGIIFGIFLIFWIFFLLAIRAYIPYAATVIKAIAGLAIEYPSSQVALAVAILIQAIWVMFWAYTVMLVQHRFSDIAIKAMSVYLAFSFYWTTQVILNIAHVTNSGFVATWYFMSGTYGMPKAPVFASLKRAVTTSFGSIAYGSLLVAIIQTLRALLRSNGERNILTCIVEFLLRCIEDILRYFNHYAYVYIAVYGKSFCDSAKSVWELFTNTGLMCLMQDSIMDKILYVAHMVGAIVIGILGVLISSPVGLTGGARYFMGCSGFVIGYVVMTIVLGVIGSGISTIYVCFAEDREALRRNNPELHDAIMDTFGGKMLANATTSV